MKSHRGFSLIELMIAIAIMGILLALGLPAYNTFISNAKLRASAQSFLSGLQLARSEAVRRNAGVDFVLTDEDVSGPNFDSVVTSATGRNWLIRTNNLTTYIEGKFGADGSGRSMEQATPIAVSGPTGTITFNGFGGTTLGAAATFEFTNPSAGTCAGAGGQVRCLNVTIAIGGQARICDPAIGPAAVAAGDTRGCL